jgi:hypothetical protein
MSLFSQRDQLEETLSTIVMSLPIENAGNSIREHSIEDSHMARRIVLQGEELAILREALRFMERRIFDPADSKMLHEMADKIEDAILDRKGLHPLEMELTDDRLQLISQVLLTYADHLNHPGADPSNRSRCLQIGEMVDRWRPAGKNLGGLITQLKRIFGSKR